LRVEGRGRPWRGAMKKSGSCRGSARRGGSAQLGALYAGEAMQPPCAGKEDSLAARQVVGAGFAVPVDESLIALLGLDTRPGILANKT
jgi:hypothetical protein